MTFAKLFWIVNYAIYSAFSSKVKEKFKDVIGGAVEALTQNILNGPMKVPFAFLFSLSIARSSSSSFSEISFIILRRFSAKHTFLL